MTNFELFIFDLDGTLVETAPEIADAVNDTLAERGWSQVTQQQVNDWIGHGTLSLLLEAVASSTAQTVQAVKLSPDMGDLVAAYNRHYERRCGTRSALYPGVQQALDGLRALGKKLAIVTNKETRYTRAVMAAHNLDDAVDWVICGDTLPTKKPDPAGVLDCLKRFDIAPERALFVGDSSIDVATARNAGVAVWVLPYGYNMGQPIANCGADRLIDSCLQLLDH